DQRRGRTVNRIILVRLHGALFIHDIARDVEHAAHDAVTDGHGDGRASVNDLEAAFEALGAGHGDGANPGIAEVLLDFEGELGGLILDFVIDGQGVVDGGERPRKFYIDDGADDLDNFAFIHVW